MLSENVLQLTQNANVLEVNNKMINIDMKILKKDDDRELLKQ